MFATSRLRGFAGLCPSDKRLFVRALVLVPLAAVTLRMLGLRRTQSLLVRPARRRPAQEAIDPFRVAQLVELAARRGAVRTKCLATSVALQSLLANTGLSTELRIGVRKRGTRLEAHAWVEYGGQPLLEAADVHLRYRAFAPGAAAGSR